MICENCGKNIPVMSKHITVAGHMGHGFVRRDRFCLACWRAGNVAVMKAPEKKVSA
jgi:hypothetical protein